MQTNLDLFNVSTATPSVSTASRKADAARADRRFDDALDEAERPASERRSRRSDEDRERRDAEAAAGLNAQPEQPIDRSLRRSEEPGPRVERAAERAQASTPPAGQDSASRLSIESSAGESKLAPEKPEQEGGREVVGSATGEAATKDQISSRLEGPMSAGDLAKGPQAQAAADQAPVAAADDQAPLSPAAARPAPQGQTALDPGGEASEESIETLEPAASGSQAQGEGPGEDGDQDDRPLAPEEDARTETAAEASDLDLLDEATDDLEAPPIRATNTSSSAATPSAPTPTIYAASEAPGVTPASISAASPLATTPAAPRLESLVEQLRLNVAPGLSRISFIVDPPELGRVTVRLVMRRGRLFGELSAEHEDVARTLERGLDSLKNTLRESGINVENLRVQQEDAQAGQAFTDSQSGSQAGERERSDRRTDREELRGESARSMRTTVDAADSDRINLMA